MASTTSQTVRQAHTPQPGTTAARREALAFAGILLLATALRLYRLDAQSLWFDEGFTVGIARLGWLNFARLLADREANMAVYYVALKLWLLMGHGEAFLRSLSAVFGVAGVAAVFRLGRRFFDPATAAVAALLLAVNAFYVHFAQEARGYTLAVLLVVLSSHSLLAATEEPDRRAWRWYVLWSALAVYAHAYAALVLLAHWIWVLSLRRPARAEAARAIRFTLYALLPMAIAALRIGTAPIQWLPFLSRQLLADTLRDLAGGGGWAAVVLLGIACAGGTWAGLGSREPARSRFILLLLWAALPGAVVLLGSLYRPMLMGRYLLICLPPAALLAAACLRRLPKPAAIPLLVGLGGVCLAASVRNAGAALPGHDDWRGASRYLLAQARPGDAAYFYSTPGWAGFDYYRWLDGRPGQVPEVVSPAFADPNLNLMVKPLAEVLPHANMDHPRLWLVLNQHRPGGTPDFGSRATRAWIGRFYVPVAETSFRGIDLVLYRHR